MKHSFYLLAVTFFIISSPAADETIPESMINARESFQRDFVRTASVVQDKYRKALEQYQRNFVRAGKIVSAKEARDEVRRASLWKTIPFKLGERSLQDPELQQLLQNYEMATSASITPIVDRYTATLESLKQAFASSGDLTSALKVDAELAKLKTAEGLPTELGAKQHYENFSKDKFRIWLAEQEFEFSGSIAGKTRLKVHEKNNTLTYRSINKVDGVTYDFRILSDRALEIDGRFRLEFARDLQSATFESARDTYPVIINPDETKDIPSGQ